MASRLELQSKLEELLGSRQVFSKPPESRKIEYPAIMYSLKNIRRTFANNGTYYKMNCYEIIVIGKKQNTEIMDKLLELPYCSYDRSYKADNLVHDVFTLFY